MPLTDYIAETMALFRTTPTASEICVQRVNFLRHAEAEGRFDAVLAAVNPASAADMASPGRN
jgi:uncharacterized oxidoreductase